MHLPVAGLVLLLACFRAPSGSTRFPATSVAHKLGVYAYDIIRADQDDLDVRFEGLIEGRVTAEARGNVVSQRMTIESRSPFVLRTSPYQVAVGRPDGSHVLARNEAGTWVPVDPVVPADTSQIALILAVDIDLAVQGASMIWDGKEYVFCTWECVRASECTGQRPLATCAPRIVRCAACLEQEP